MSNNNRPEEASVWRTGYFMITKQDLERHLEPEEKLMAVFSAQVYFAYVPHAHPSAIDLEATAQPNGLVVFTSHRILIWHETGTINKRQRMYTAPLSHVNAVLARFGPTERSQSTVALMLPAGLCCYIALAGPDMKRVHDLEHLLARAIIAPRATTGPVDDEGALAAIHYNEEEKRRQAAAAREEK